MNGRLIQMVAAGVSVTVMVVVLVLYLTRDDAPPASSADTQPHVGAKHHTAEPPRHQGGELSPIQVYERAQVGDWIAYKVITESSLAPTITTTVVARVSKVTPTHVTRSFKGLVDATGEVRGERDEVRPRTGLTIDLLTENDVGGWTFYDLVVTDDVHEVGGRAFPCKKLAYASDDPMFPRKRTRNELWISSEVPAGGLVEEIEVQELDDMRFVITKRLIGFGTAAGTTWGDKPAAL